MSEHIGELAELYALGALEPAESVAVERHVAGCAVCRAALGRAEATVLALDDAFVPLEAPPPRLSERIARAARDVVPIADGGSPQPPSLAPRPHVISLPQTRLAAAAFVLGAALSIACMLPRDAGMRDALARDDFALATLVHAHFEHAQLTPLRSTAPKAKALYARDGSWVYLIVDTPDCACRAVLVRGGSTVDLGKPRAAPGGATATAFTSDAGRPQKIELLDEAGGPLNSATIAYPHG